MADEQIASNPYELVLADLEAQRAKIDAAITVIRAAMGMNPNVSLVNATPPGTDVNVAMKAGAFHGMTIPEAAKLLLSIRKTPMGNQDIADQLIAGGIAFTTQTPVNTVASVLHRASKSGEIVKVGRGKWGLAAWYPNPGRFQPKKKGEAEVEAPAVATTPIQWPKAAT